MVLPDASIVYVNDVSYPDLFFGLKGGFNNFGIVTRFTMRVVPQTYVYGVILYYNPILIRSVIQAVVTFQTLYKDPKAQILVTFIIVPGQYLIAVLLFYDAPTAPSGIFDDFLNIPSFGGLATQPYLSFIQATPVDATANLR